MTTNICAFTGTCSFDAHAHHRHSHQSAHPPISHTYLNHHAWANIRSRIHRLRSYYIYRLPETETVVNLYTLLTWELPLFPSRPQRSTELGVEDNNVVNVDPYGSLNTSTLGNHSEKLGTRNRS